MRLPRGVHRLLRLRSRRHEVEDAVDEEMAHHLQMRVDELVARGHRPDEARRIAEAAFGDHRRYRAECVAEQRREARMTWGREVLAGIVGDARYGLRGMRKAPAFTAAVVVTLGIGIGANVAIFTVVDALMLRPIPFYEPDELYQVTSRYPEQGYAPVYHTARGAVAWREAAGVLPVTELWGRASMVRTDGPDPVALSVVGITPGMLDLLRVSPRMGRPLNREDGLPGADPVILVSEGFWASQLGGDPGALGRDLILDGRPFRIVGIMPDEFRFPTVGITELWTALADDATLAGRELRQVMVVTRIPPDELDVAEQRLTTFAPRIAELGPLGDDPNWVPRLHPLNEPAANSDVRNALWMVFGAVGVMFVIALVNGVNLALARATTRTREIGVRLALGGGRARVAGQLLVESLVLAALAGLAAVAIAELGVSALMAAAPDDLTFGNRRIGIDERVLAFAGLMSTTAGLLFGVVPALKAVRASDATSTSALSTYGEVTRAGHRVRGGLVVLQMSLSVTLLFGAALLGRSFLRLVNVDPGFEPDGLVALELSFSEGRHTAEQRIHVVSTLEERLTALPGVSSVGRSIGLPPESGITFGEGLYVDGRAEPLIDGSLVYPFLSASAGFRRHFGIELLTGRDFSAEDDLSQRPVLINLALATHLGGADEAVGARFRLGPRGDYSTVVGVVENVKLFGLDDRWGREGIIRLDDPGRDYTFVSFTVRTDRDPASVIPELRSAVRQIDPEQPIYGLATIADEMWQSVARPRFFASLMAVFAALALLLASAGLYGVLSFAVGRRTREMGIRMALGAGARGVRALVLASGLRLGVFGAALGVGGSLWAAGLLDAQLFDTSARDLPTLAAVALVMLAVTALASYLPARRATRIDVVNVLKAD